MPVTVILGCQWGDEGKGKVVDLLGQRADVVARYQGGANAGHTIVWGNRSFVLHLIPSGIFTADTTCVIGNGVVIDPAALSREIAAVERLGYHVKGRLHISLGAHLILPYHKALEKAREAARAQRAIGTTGRGIGPAYVDKAARTGIRVVDLLCADTLSAKVRANVKEKNALLRHVHSSTELDAEAILSEVIKVRAAFAPLATDTTALLLRALAADRHILAEGAQGALLDVDFGTYPYVTSSHPTVGGACTGLGIPPSAISEVIGIAKAYCTRVGNGPFPTELSGMIGDHLRSHGQEYGATTGRPRRCGWLDLVALRYANAINGVTELAVTKLDVLSGLDLVRVCTGYRIGAERTDQFPTDAQALRDAAPIYTTLAGWNEDIRGVRTYGALPQAARDLVAFIARGTGKPVGMISTGPRRSETIRVRINP